jgi:hypothetical protein
MASRALFYLPKPAGPLTFGSMMTSGRGSAYISQTCLDLQILRGIGSQTPMRIDVILCSLKPPTMTDLNNLG